MQIEERTPDRSVRSLPLLLQVLLQVLVLAGCVSLEPAAKQPPSDDAVRSAQAAADAARLAAAQTRAQTEPRYLRFKADETQLTAAWDDGRHTYLEFGVPAMADLEFFDEEGRPVASATAGKVAAVQGLHAGLLVRSSDRASFISPNPRALSLPRTPLPAGVDFGEARAKLENQAGQLQAMQRAIDAARRIGGARAVPAPPPPWVTQASAAEARHLPHSPGWPQRDADFASDVPPRGPGLVPLSLANASASAPDRGLVRIFFATASRAIVAPDDGLGLLLQEAAKADEIRVTGFTDATGSREANAMLALARADAVAQILLRRGIPPDRIRSRAVGADDYIADNASDRGRALNRRAEVLLLKNGQPLAFGSTPRSAR